MVKRSRSTKRRGNLKRKATRKMKVKTRKQIGGHNSDIKKTINLIKQNLGNTNTIDKISITPIIRMCLFYYDNISKKIVLDAVEIDGMILGTDLLNKSVFINDMDVVAAAVQQNGMALQYTSAELQGDREIVMEAVNNNGMALQYATEKLQRDREIVMVAVKQDGEALQYASERLKGIKEIVMAAVKQDGEALEYATTELQKHPDITQMVRTKIKSVFKPITPTNEGEINVTFDDNKSNSIPSKFYINVNQTSIRLKDGIENSQNGGIPGMLSVGGNNYQSKHTTIGPIFGDDNRIRLNFQYVYDEHYEHYGNIRLNNESTFLSSLKSSEHPSKSSEHPSKSSKKHSSKSSEHPSKSSKKHTSKSSQHSNQSSELSNLNQSYHGGSIASELSDLESMEIIDCKEDYTVCGKDGKVTATLNPYNMVDIFQKTIDDGSLVIKIGKHIVEELLKDDMSNYESAISDLNPKYVLKEIDIVFNPYIMFYINYKLTYTLDSNITYTPVEKYDGSETASPTSLEWVKPIQRKLEQKRLNINSQTLLERPPSS